MKEEVRKEGELVQELAETEEDTVILQSDNLSIVDFSKSRKGKRHVISK